VEGTPRFTKGGRISERILRETKEKENIFGVISIVRTMTGLDVEKPDASGVENALYKGMTRFLRRAGRETSGIGFILDYLWRCSMEARNLGVLLYGGESEREAIKEELV
jgi:vacuolar-type H+-ATPase subunit C/Vma6